MIPAFAIIILTIVGNNMIVGKPLKKIVSEAAYAALILTAAQAKSSFIDFMAV
jgi:hypothetical protein